MSLRGPSSFPKRAGDEAISTTDNGRQGNQLNVVIDIRLLRFARNDKLFKTLKIQLMGIFLM